MAEQTLSMKDLKAAARTRQISRLRDSITVVFASKTAIVGLVIVLLWVLVAIFAPLLTQYTPFELSEVRRRELYEVFHSLPGGIRYLSVPGSEVAPPSWQVSKPSTQQIIPGQATPLLPNEAGVDIDQTPEPSGKSPKSHLWPPASEDLDDEDDD